MITVLSSDNKKSIGVCSFDEISTADNIVLALGMFDGVHIAHKAIMRKTVQLAQELNASPTVFTFCNHPSEIVSPENVPYLLTTNTERAILSAECGIKQMILTWFDDVFAELSPEEFAEKYIFGLNVSAVVCGYDYRFGRNASGDTQILGELLKKRNIKLEVIDRMMIDGITVGSTYVRRLIDEGNVREASRFLGNDYLIGGQVVHGFERGRTLGFPTANIIPDKKKTLPPKGVWATRTTVDGVKYISVTNIGNNPTFNNEETSVETYLLDFSGDLYDKYIIVEFREKIRSEIRFDDKEGLKAALANDIVKAKAVFDM